MSPLLARWDLIPHLRKARGGRFCSRECSPIFSLVLRTTVILARGNNPCPRRPHHKDDARARIALQDGRYVPLFRFLAAFCEPDHPRFVRDTRRSSFSLSSTFCVRCSRVHGRTLADAQFGRFAPSMISPLAQRDQRIQCACFPSPANRIFGRPFPFLLFLFLVMFPPLSFLSAPSAFDYLGRGREFVLVGLYRPACERQLGFCMHPTCNPLVLFLFVSQGRKRASPDFWTIARSVMLACGSTSFGGRSE